MTNKNHLTDTQIKYYFKKFISFMKVHINDNVMLSNICTQVQAVEGLHRPCVSTRGDISVYFLQNAHSVSLIVLLE